MSGWHKTFVHTRTGKRSTTLRELLPECTPGERQLSAAFFECCMAGRGPGGCSPFMGIRQGPGPLTCVEAWGGPSASQDLHPRLAHALAESLAGAGEVAVAVSGGIDSWLLAAILKSEGYRVCGWYLESGVPGYCERDQVERSARILGIPCRYVRVTENDFLQAVPEFVAITETPIYNLHPVSKWLLANALRREGIDTVVTGDGADQVMRHEWDCDLLPMTLTCFQNAGVRLVAPFLAERVMAFCRRPYPDKRPVRELAQQLGVPMAAKHPTLFPPVELPAHPRADLPVGAAGDYKTASLSYTTGLLLQALEAHQQCAESLA
jgi:PP-loop superfamily ATP-utilizing enzyme